MTLLLMTRGLGKMLIVPFRIGVMNGSLDHELIGPWSPLSRTAFTRTFASITSPPPWSSSKMGQYEAHVD